MKLPMRGSLVRRAWVLPALGSGAATLVAVTVVNLSRGHDSDGFDRHRIGASSPKTSQAATAPHGAKSGPLVLEADGLQLVDFGQARDSVLEQLSPRLGKPDEDKAQPCRNQRNATSRWVRWADLTVIFSTRMFVGYIDGVHFPPGRPALHLSTAKGLSPGDPVDRLRQLYGDVPIRQETPQPGQIAVKTFAIPDGKPSQTLSGVLENQGSKTVISTIFAGELC